MRRVLLIVAIALIAFEATGVAVAIETTCFEHCEDDGPGGQCAPTCQDCVCCAQLRAIQTVNASERPTVAPTLTAAWPAQSPPDSPDPNEILRVPKLALV